VATQADVRRIALALEGVTEDPEDLRFYVNGKQFLWLWQERVDPKKARVPNPGVVVTRVPDDVAKQVILASDRAAYFTEPHYDGYSAVLIRLVKIRVPALRERITESYEIVRERGGRGGAPAIKRSASRARRPRRASGGSRGRQPRAHPG